MGTPVIFATEEFLSPISEEAPAGEDIRADASPSSPYYAVKDARVAARAAERANIEDASAIPDEWQIVLDTGIEILKTKSKDLEIAAWMVEAMVRLAGFAGLRDGFRLIEGLVTQFWDGLYPQPDEDGISTRVAAVSGLNGEGGEGTLILPIRKVPLTHGTEHAFALWQFEQATDLERQADPEKKAAKVADGAVSMEAFTASVAATRAGDFIDLIADIEAAQEALAAMGAALDQAAGSDAPSCGKLRDTLAAVADAVRFFAADKLAEAAAGDDAAAGDETPPAGSGAEAEAAGGGEGGRKRRQGYETREEALAELTRIAAFFRKYEPHSPISYTLEEVVRRGSLTLPQLLEELVQDAEARRLFLLSSGIRVQTAETSSDY